MSISSIDFIEKRVIEILEELQEIRKKMDRNSQVSRTQEIDFIKNALVKKITNHKISPEFISIDSIAYGCQILEEDATEIYNYLKSVGLIING